MYIDELAECMDDEGIAPNTYLQLIQWVWTGRHACKLYWNIVYWRDFPPIPTGSAVNIGLNSLVFHFAGSSTFIQLRHL